jgi:squalene synthase HpnC
MASPIQHLERFGPDRCEALAVGDARAWCRRLAGSHYENFSVLSSLVPHDRRDDFAAVYAFCRWADDLGDEAGDPARSLELLGWWRRELQACFQGSPRHPVFVALRPTIERCELPIEPFDDLIQAFEQDQAVTRYDTWHQLIDYCARSANPVGRLVLMVLGEDRADDRFAMSDAVCTALQLTNHWQDVKRDLLERDRIYVPRDMIKIRDFEDRLRRSASQGWAVDHAFLGESRALIRACVNRTWPLFEKGAPLPDTLSPSARPVVWLFAAGGQRVLSLIEMWNYETVLHRPTLSKAAKALLIGRAWIMSRSARARAPRGSAA